MLVIISGTNKDTRLAEVKKIAKEFTRYDGDALTPDFIQELLGGDSLFASIKEPVVIIDALVSLIGDSIRAACEQISESKRLCILLEEKLLAADKKLFGDIKNIKLIAVAEPFKQKDNRSFAFADKVMARDKVGAWTMYRNLIDAGLEARGLHGTLVWKIKDTLLNGNRFGKNNFSNIELAAMLQNLTMLVHDSMRTNSNIEHDIELFLLKNL